MDKQLDVLLRKIIVNCKKILEQEEQDENVSFVYYAAPFRIAVDIAEYYKSLGLENEGDIQKSYETDGGLLNQFVDICKLSLALASTANCDHPWAKDFKNRMLAKIAHLPKEVRSKIHADDGQA